MYLSISFASRSCSLRSDLARNQKIDRMSPVAGLDCKVNYSNLRNGLFEMKINPPKRSPYLMGPYATGFVAGFGLTALIALASGIGFWIGHGNSKTQGFGEEIPHRLHASTAAQGSDMSVATARIDDDVEGIYFLDAKTGDLQCWVYYPRNGQFGGQFAANISANIPVGKNAELLMVTGQVTPASGSANSRPASSLVYVVDTKGGTFAAYTFAWNKSLQNSGQVQGGQLVYVGGGPIRN